MDKKHRFGPSDYRVKSTETVFQGFFKMTRMLVEHRLFGGGWSKPLRRELFQRGDAVGVLLYDPHNHRIGLIEQFRPGALNEVRGPWQYEVIAGMVAPGETPEQTAVRELQEESGVAVEKLLPICDYLVSSGGTDEKMHLFCGTRGPDDFPWISTNHFGDFFTSVFYCRFCFPTKGVRA